MVFKIIPLGLPKYLFKVTFTLHTGYFLDIWITNKNN